MSLRKESLGSLPPMSDAELDREIERVKEETAALIQESERRQFVNALMINNTIGIVMREYEVWPPGIQYTQRNPVYPTIKRTQVYE